MDLGQSGHTWCAEHFALLGAHSLEVAPGCHIFCLVSIALQKMNLENSELSLLWVWGFVLFLRILMPFSSFLFTELVSFHFTHV